MKTSELLRPRLHVWVVDDDPIQILIFEKILATLGEVKEVTTFDQAREAINVLVSAGADQLPDFIFLDLNMPGMDGWQFLDAYSLLPLTTTSNITIVMASSSLDPADEKRAREHPYVKNFMAKPGGHVEISGLLRDHQISMGSGDGFHRYGT